MLAHRVPPEIVSNRMPDFPGLWRLFDSLPLGAAEG
jgi:hypothetical protein